MHFILHPSSADNCVYDVTVGACEFFLDIKFNLWKYVIEGVVRTCVNVQINESLEPECYSERQSCPMLVATRKQTVDVNQLIVTGFCP